MRAKVSFGLTCLTPTSKPYPPHAGGWPSPHHRDDGRSTSASSCSSPSTSRCSALSLVPGLSLGMLLGVLVIVAAWVLTWIYVRWANTHYDASLQGLRHDVGARRTERHRDRVLRDSSSCCRWASRSGRRVKRARPISSMRRAAASRPAERTCARRRLHERGELPRHRRPRRLSGFDGLIYSIGFLVGWPIVMFLIAEPLRNLGRYTFADVVAVRLRQTPIRIAAAIGALAVIAFYLIAQMVGAGNLIRLLFGLAVRSGGRDCWRGDARLRAVRRDDRHHVGADREGGAAARRATLLALLVLARFGFNPLALFAQASATYGAGVLAPGRLVTRSDRRDLARPGADARHGRTAAHPDALLHRARREDGTDVGWLRDGVHRLLLPADVHPRLRCDGHHRPRGDHQGRRRRQHGGAAAG